MTDRFSDRHGFGKPAADIAIRYEAPVGLRKAILRLAEDQGMRPNRMRELMRGVILDGFDELGQWSEYPNVWNDVNYEMDECDWYKVYDVAEIFYRALSADQQITFENRLNRYMSEQGIGWAMRDGQVEYQGAESFVVATEAAEEVLASRGFDRAAREVREAMVDLSRRPMPDLTGAATHAFGALEAVAREDTGQHKKTLGQLVPDLDLQPPLGEVMSKLWGFASDTVRHISEKKDIEAPEAEFAVTVACALATLVASKQPPSTPSVADADDLPFE